MKVIPKYRKITKSDDFKEEFFGIKNEGLPFVFSILRDKIYSDKILAVVREVSQNASDEHIASGKSNLPIQVHLPNSLEPYFKVRDFGNGLSEKEMYEIYVQYGTSTKRNNNDVTGFLGLGSKSVMCYADSSVIVSYHKGKKTTYSVYVDKSGIGKIAKIGEEFVNGETGLEVTVPVKPIDFESFRSKSFELYRYYKVKPIISGVSNPPSLEPEKGELEGTNWVYTGNERTVCVMGFVPYKLDKYQVSDKFTNTELEILGAGFDLFFDLGELEVSASRESLELTNVTIKAIKKKLAVIQQELPVLINKRIADAKTLIKAKQFYHEFVYNGVGASLSNIINKQVNWRGQNVTEYSIMLRDIVKDDSIVVYDCIKKRSYRTGRITLSKQLANYLVCIYDILLFDIPSDREIKSRLKSYFKDENDDRRSTNVQLIWFKTPEAKATFEAYTGLDTNTLDKLSNYERLTLNNTTGTKHKTGTKEEPASYFNLDLTNLDKFANGIYRRWYDRVNKSQLWVQNDNLNENTGGVCVQLNRWTVVGSEFLNDDTSKFNRIVKALKILHLNPDLVGIRKKQFNNLTQNWVHFDTWLAEKLEEQIALIDYDLQKEANDIQTNSAFFAFDLLRKSLDKLSPENPLHDYFALVDAARTTKVNHSKIEAIEYLCEVCKLKPKTEKQSVKLQIKQAYEEINKTYPMLKYLCTYSNFENKSPSVADICEYMRLCENALEKKQDLT